MYQIAELLPGDGIDQDSIQQAIRQLLQAVGEDPDRQERLVDTPKRIAEMYTELLDGDRVDPIELLNGALFEVKYDEMVVVRDIEFYSLCEHHMLPLLGRAHFAYLPRDRVIGLSKIPRIVDMFSRRLQVQERLTTQIADFLEETLQPRGVAVVVEAAHMCATLRVIGVHGRYASTLDSVVAFIESLPDSTKAMAFTAPRGGTFTPKSLLTAPKSNRPYTLMTVDTSAIKKYLLEDPDGYGSIGSLTDDTRVNKPSWED